MKAYLGIKFHTDNRNRQRIELISGAMEAWKTESVLALRPAMHMPAESES